MEKIWGIILGMYYDDKVGILRRIFGREDCSVKDGFLTVGATRYPILDDVIILSPTDKYSPFVKKMFSYTGYAADRNNPAPFAKDIQYTFGEEWRRYAEILPEHKEEFLRYFDMVDLKALRGRTVCDLGCGNGRWSYHLKDIAGEMILVDFSDAIFTARKNLRDAANCLFFMCDLKDIPFKDDFADLLFCLGVLHHLPTPCLDEARGLKRYAPELLVYLYYSLDNRPAYFRLLLGIVTFMRRGLSKIHHSIFRAIFVKCAAYLIYMPLISLGTILKPVKLSRYIPLYGAYHGKNVKRIEQDVYDRFFTGIEQRVSRKGILGLRDTFADVMVSDGEPYWHFICRR